MSLTTSMVGCPNNSWASCQDQCCVVCDAGRALGFSTFLQRLGDIWQRGQYCWGLHYVFSLCRYCLCFLRRSGL